MSLEVFFLIIKVRKQRSPTKEFYVGPFTAEQIAQMLQEKLFDDDILIDEFRTMSIEVERSVIDAHSDCKDCFIDNFSNTHDIAEQIVQNY